MALSRSRLRSELLANNSAETKALLTKIATLFAANAASVVFEVGATRYRGQDCQSVVIDPTLGSAQIQFKSPPITSAAHATGTLQDLTFTAAATGTGGNAITVAYTAGATAGSEVVSVTGNAISVQIATGSSTATQVKAALDASSPAAALISTAISGTSAHAQTAPAGPASLSGGTAASTVQNYDLSDIRMIKRLRTKKWLIAIFQTANPA